MKRLITTVISIALIASFLLCFGCVDNRGRPGSQQTEEVSSKKTGYTPRTDYEINKDINDRAMEERNRLATCSFEEFKARYKENINTEKVAIYVIDNDPENRINYTVDSFPELDTLSEVVYKNISYKAKYPIPAISAYRGFLSEPTLENCYETLKKLNQRDDIWVAEPALFGSYTEWYPNDTEYYNGNQWAIDKIDLPWAWTIKKGDSTVKVGIVDSGIDVTNPDLSGRVNTSLSTCFSTQTNALSDTYGHGTKVAGIIGAATNNSTGIAGVCWYVDLISLKVHSLSGIVDLDVLDDVITYAENNGIKILNFSFASEEDIPGLYTAISNYDGLVVCSAGNNTGDNDVTPMYPANYNLHNLITVGATTQNDYVNYNYGQTSVDLFAPGVNVITTTNDSSNRYSNVSGTSFSAPYVAGVAALILSKYPSLSPYEIKLSIMNNVDQINGFDDYCVSGGRLNAYNALHNYFHFHSYSWYTDYSDTHHKGYCSICEEFVELLHNTNYCVNLGFTNGHDAYCSKCGRYMRTENHVWIYRQGRYFCKCGIITDVIVAKEPEESETE